MCRDSDLCVRTKLMNASTSSVAEFVADPVSALRELIGDEAVETREEELRFASQDLFFEGALPIAVVSPGSTQEVAAVAKWCHANRIAICPRGGGMSYTDAFQPRG